MLRTAIGRTGPSTAPRAMVMALLTLWTWTARIPHVLAVWHQRARERRQLASMGPDMLKDLGLGRCEVAKECAKPFWRA